MQVSEMRRLLQAGPTHTVQTLRRSPFQRRAVHPVSEAHYPVRSVITLQCIPPLYPERQETRMECHRFRCGGFKIKQKVT